jgi:hypothetical protein
MKDKWIINIIDKIGFSCYDVVEVFEVVDLGDTYNIITAEGDIFLEKDYCYISGGVVQYNTEFINVYMEKI